MGMFQFTYDSRDSSCFVRDEVNFERRMENLRYDDIGCNCCYIIINIGLISIQQQQPQKYSKTAAMNQPIPGPQQPPSSPTTKYRNRKLYKPPPAQDNSSNFVKLAIVILISFIFIAGQFIGGIISHSISVISDAFHLVTDLIGFVVAFVFIYYTKKGPNDRMSFGYHRMELLGALGNLFIIWALAIFLLYQATTRIINKEFVREPKIMLLVAVVGLPINIIMYFVLHGNSHSHGLMSEECGSEYSVSINGNDDEPCHGALCKDYSCQAYNQIGEHCHRKVGEELEIHKHNKQIANQQIKNGQHVHNNCSHDHTHQGHNHQRHDHAHDHGHEHDHEHDHDHDHAGHSHSHAGHSHGHGGHSHQNMSMKAAVLHALCTIYPISADIIQSIGLIISALIIFFFGSGHDVGSQVTQWNDWHYVDPITTYIFCIIVFISTIPITKNCYHIIMESTPGHISIKEIQQEFLKIKGVSDVHDLHVWDLRPGKTILIAHVFSEKNQETHVLKKLTDFSRKKRIYHSTFQVEEQQLRHNEEYILCDHDIH